MSQFYFRNKLLCFFLAFALVPSLAQQNSLKKDYEDALRVEKESAEEAFNQLAALTKKFTQPIHFL